MRAAKATLRKDDSPVNVATENPVDQDGERQRSGS